MKRIAIIHPWLPQYRQEFFRQLLDRAEEEGLQIDVFHGQVAPRWAGRNDGIDGDGERIVPLPTRFIRISSKTLAIKSLQPVRQCVRDHGRYDLVIVEQAVKNLETYGLLLRPVGPLAFWGHGRTYSDSSTPLIEWAKKRLTKKGNWFFAYTHGGKDAVVRNGFPSERITVLNNTFDTRSLRAALDSVTENERQEIAASLDLRGKTALYSGGLDSYKRIPMLIETARAAHRIDPDFRLIIMGDGAERPLVEAAAQGGSCIRYVGAQFGRAKAAYLDAADLIVSPGSIGLLAVDGLVAERPVVMTNWPLHGPEAEYLKHGRNAIVTPDSATQLAAGLVQTLNNIVLLDQLKKNCSEDAEIYTIENMVSRFIDGVHAALAVTLS